MFLLDELIMMMRHVVVRSKEDREISNAYGNYFYENCIGPYVEHLGVDFRSQFPTTVPSA